MKRIVLVAAMTGLVWLGACSRKPQAGAGSALPDSTGVFVDACRLLVDSIVVEKDRLFIFDGGYPSPQFVSDRSGDTVFYGQFAFIRMADGEGGGLYSFGYNHRGSRSDWGGALFLEVVPKRLLAERKEHGFPCPPEK